MKHFNLKEEFIAYALTYSECIKGDNDPKKVNRLVDKIGKIYHKVKTENSDFFFLELMNHENEGVRYFAATYSLPIQTEIAEYVLLQIVKDSKSFIGNNALSILDIWKKGLLKW